jgi:hypothetical protein
MLAVIPFMLILWLVFLLPVAGLVWLHRRYALSPPVGSSLAALLSAALVALAGFVAAKLVIGQPGYAQPSQMLFMYAVIVFGILLGAGLGVALFSHLRQYQDADRTESERTFHFRRMLLYAFWVAAAASAVLAILLYFSGAEM